MTDAPHDADLLRTLAGASTVEIDRVRGSRFVADAAPASDEATALAFLEQVRERTPDATHHCWAFHLESGRSRSSDDGEPAGTAGAPILRRITGSGLADVVVVVTRWFGGTKLGTGGLVRAYGAAAQAVLAEANIVERPVVVGLDLRHPYDLSGVVEGVLHEHGARVVTSDYGAEVALRIVVPRAGAERFRAAVTEATAGRVVPRSGDDLPD